jgi:hypothetical protein
MCRIWVPFPEWGPIEAAKGVSLPTPSFPQRGVGVCTGPRFGKRKKPPEILIPLLSFSLLMLDCSKLRSTHGEMGQTKNYSEILSFV